MERFLQTVDAISASLVALDAERLVEILRALEEDRDGLLREGASSTPALRQSAEERLRRLRAILAASEQNLKVLRNLYLRSQEFAWQADRSRESEVDLWRR